MKLASLKITLIFLRIARIYRANICATPVTIHITIIYYIEIRWSVIALLAFGRIPKDTLGKSERSTRNKDRIVFIFYFLLTLSADSTPRLRKSHRRKIQPGFSKTSLQMRAKKTNKTLSHLVVDHWHGSPEDGANVISLNLTEFNWIATPSPNCVGNPGWHRTRKPMAYRVSRYTHSPHLNIPRSFKIVIYLILEHIYTSSINTFPWQSIPLIYRSLRKCILSYV